MPATSDLAQAFDVFIVARLQSSTLENVWRRAFGSEYPEEARPDAFYPQSILNRIVDIFGPTCDGRLLLDVACGHGLTGLYLARRLGMKLCGIDISPSSVEIARQNATQAISAAEEAVQAEFSVRDASSTGLEASTCAAVVCLDTMLYFQDQLATMREMNRVLEPGGYLAFTTWEQKGYNP